MKSTASFIRALRVSAGVILVSGLVLWAASGTRLGWTQTSVVTMQHDEITGIDFPVREPAFVAGVEVPLLAAGIAAAVAELSVLVQRRSLSARA